MNKFTLFLLFTLISSFTQAKVEFAWSGITNLVIKDQVTTLHFDPSFTRPNIIKVLLNLSIQSDEELVTKTLAKLNLTQVNAIFISHSHYDHALDFDIVAKKFQAQVWGTLTTKNLGLSLGVAAHQLNIIENEKVIEVGAFKITPFAFPHPKILDIYEYCSGELTEVKVLPLKPCDYKEGINYSYLIEHEKKFYLFHQSSRSTPEFIQKIQTIIGDQPLQVSFQGIANRSSTEDLIKNVIRPFRPLKIVPMHFDNFFLDFNPDNMSYLWGVNLEEFKSSAMKNNLELIIAVPYQYYSI